MPDTYTGDDVPSDEPKTITRPCREPAGCGGSISITVDPDGSYDGGHYFGMISIPTENAVVEGEYMKPDEWFDSLHQTRWSEERNVEFWMHESCAKPDKYDPGDVPNSVAN